ncbi:MAG: hypothetical protein M1825_003412 [Sarcosagium campestre]|nr:MAG: hypothetical protein M1825_003412 [Sarcosagium campestre]
MPTVYFAYGSNLWLAQMARRCPESKPQNVAYLRDWNWIINERHYANVIPSKGDIVYGLTYLISPEDEKSLDGFEGVPIAYSKVTIAVDEETSDNGQRRVEALVYVDYNRTGTDVPRQEYVERMNYGIQDALRLGVPQWYVDKYLRPFIPPLGGRAGS